MMNKQEEYWGMGFKGFISRILPAFLYFWVTFLILMNGAFASDEVLISQNISKRCIGNYTLQSEIFISIDNDVNYTIPINETCPYGCFEDYDKYGAGCGPDPMELTGLALGVIFVMFAIIYGWARLTHKKKRF